MLRTNILPDYVLNKFELQRDDLLAQYEGSPEFRPAGDYTAAQFARRHKLYAHQLTNLLDGYVAEHPDLRDALGLELSLPRTSQQSNATVAYQFDGLLLPERLLRRVGRLRLPAGRVIFPALDRQDARYQTEVSEQQRYHYTRALVLACQLAQASTRDLLTTPAVVSALQRLRAFGPTDVPTQLQADIIGRTPTPELAAWWMRCGLNEDRAALRQQLRPEQEEAYAFYRSAEVDSMTAERAMEIAQFAQQAIATGSGHGFSALFHARYLACAALPVPYHQPAARVVLGVTALYGLAPELLTEAERRAAVACLHEVLRNASPQLAAVFFATLGHQPVEASQRLYLHLKFSYYPRPAGLLAHFYEAVGACLDPEEDELPTTTFKNLAAYLVDNPFLDLAQPELSACAASRIQGFYAACDFSQLADQQALQQGYELLRPLLPPDEAEVLEETLLDQVQASAEEARQWLSAPGLLASCLRDGLRRQLRQPALLVASPAYQNLQRLLLAYCPAAEGPANDQVFLARYDVQYFLTRSAAQHVAG